MRFRNFIEKIQNSDERAKRRWLVISSAITMAIVLVLWIFYVSFIFQVPSAEQTNIQTDEPGFWQIFKNGAVVVFNSASEGLKNLISQLTGEKTIVIQ